MKHDCRKSYFTKVQKKFSGKKYELSICKKCWRVFKEIELKVAVSSKKLKKEKNELEFTPDEAILVAGNIMTATMFWLINYKPYWDTFMKRKRSLTKKIDKALALLEEDKKDEK